MAVVCRFSVKPHNQTQKTPLRNGCNNVIYG